MKKRAHNHIGQQLRELRRAIPKRVIALFLASILLLQYSADTWSGLLGDTLSAPPADSWDDSWVNAMGYGALGTSFPESDFRTNIVTMTQFMADNGTGATFSLLPKYGGATFNPNAYTIMISTSAELQAFSERCYAYWEGVTPTYPVTPAEARVYLSAHYILGNNISYSHGGLVPIGIRGNVTPEFKFTGVFDGQGFEISGLRLAVDPRYYRDAGQDCPYFSLFSNIGPAGVVKNLGVITPNYMEATAGVVYKVGGPAGNNEGTIDHCFVLSAAAEGQRTLVTSPGAQVAGLAHTNTGALQQSYFAGAIMNSGNNATTAYNPVVFVGTASSGYYDSDAYDAGATAMPISGVTGVGTAALKGRSGILGDVLWYTDNYTAVVPGYPVGYPRLRGFRCANLAAPATSANSYYIARPADLVFFSNALSAYPQFGAVGVYYRLAECLNMNLVSADAYVTPQNSFAGTLDGSVEGGSACACTATAAHPGSGSQRLSHAIVNLRIRHYATVTIGSENQLMTGLFMSTSTAANSCVVRNLNIVGGDIRLPSLPQNVAYNKQANVAALAAYACVFNFQNVHSSAAVTAVGSGASDYLCSLRMGALVGNVNITSTAQLFSMTDCSNSGEISGGVHQYTGTLVLDSGVGGLIGAIASTTATNVVRTFTGLANYGKITGLAVIQNDSSFSGRVSNTYVGGIGGFCKSIWVQQTRLLNTAQIHAHDASVVPIVQYAVGGLFGYAPVGRTAVGAAGSNSFAYNSGSIFAYPIADLGTAAATAVSVAGLYGAVSHTNANGFTRAVNVGKIVIPTGILAVYAGGVGNLATSLLDSYNKGGFVNSAGDAIGSTFVLQPTYASVLGGVVGYYGGSSYSNMTTCYNYTSLNIELRDNAAKTAKEVRVHALADYALPISCENEGALSVTVPESTGYTGNVLVSGGVYYWYSGAAYGTKNNAAITVNTANHAGMLSVAGMAISGSSTIQGAGGGEASENNGAITVNTFDQNFNYSGSAGECNVAGVIIVTGTTNMSGFRNTADINVSRVRKTATLNSQTIVAGIRKGYGQFTSTTTNDIVSDCVNTGNINVDVSYDASATTTVRNSGSAQAIVAGISAYGSGLTGCTNTGNITVGATRDFQVRDIVAAGIVGRSAPSNANAVYLTDCYNTGRVSNAYSVGESGRTTATARTVIFAGIAGWCPPEVERVVNIGRVEMNITGASDGLTTYGIAGIAHSAYQPTAGFPAKTRICFQNSANTGVIRFNHSAAALPINSTVTAAGVIGIPGVGNRVAGDSLPLYNLINSGMIDVDINTEGNLAYVPASYNSTAGNNVYVASSANVSVAGVVAQPGYYGALTNVGSIPIQGCANIGDIDVNLQANTSGNASSRITYNVGGVVANTALRHTGTGAGNAITFDDTQHLKISDCVNGGNVSVAANTVGSPTAYSAAGGIVGLFYQNTNAIPAELTPAMLQSGVYNCLNFGNISGGYSTGGIIGCDASVVKNVINFGQVTGASGGSSGAIVGAVRAATASPQVRLNADYLSLVIERAVNYGSVYGLGTLGGIIGNITQAQNAAQGFRIYREIIDAGNRSFVGASVAQAGSNTFLGLYSLFSATAPAPFSGNIALKNSGPATDSGSIYYKLVPGDDVNCFPWRAGEDETGINPAEQYAYLQASDSARNAADPPYAPYVNGIYAVATTEGNSAGYYPSDNISLQNCDPNGVSGWRTASVEAALAACRQKRESTEATIKKLEITNGIAQPTLIRHGAIDEESATVRFYVIADGFTPGTYSPNLGANTLLSNNASFVGAPAIALTGSYTFDGSEMARTTWQVQPQSGDPKDWTIIVYSVAAPAPVTLTDVREGISITNTNVTTGTANIQHTNLTPSPLPAVINAVGGSAPDYAEVLTQVSNLANNTLIFYLNTSGLAYGRNRVGDVTLETEAGAAVAAAGWTRVAPSGVALDAKNFTVVPRSGQTENYVTYEGEMTLNIRLLAPLPSGRYRVVLTTPQNGTFYFYFTKEISTQADVTANPAIYLVDGTTVALAANTTTAKLTHTSTIRYGLAPDLNRLLKPGTYPNSIFAAALQISPGAVITAEPHILSITENPDKSVLYRIGFTVTAQNPDYVKEWVAEILTAAPNTQPDAIELDFKGQSYNATQLSDPDFHNQTLVVRRSESAVFNIRYNVASGNTGTGAIYNILNNNYFRFELYQNQTLLTEEQYTAQGFTITKTTVSGNYLGLVVTASQNVPNATYELKAYYTRYGKPIPLIPEQTDTDNSVTHTEITWADLPYTTFTFHKAEGRTLSYATGLDVRSGGTVSVVAADPDNKVIPWDGLNFNYAPLATEEIPDVTSALYSSYSTHRTFDIDIYYRRDTFFGSFKPQFQLPEGASLYRERGVGDWELIVEWREISLGVWGHVVVGNEAADFTNDRVIRYRVYAEDSRFYQDYAIKLRSAPRDKRVNLEFVFQDGAPANLPASAVLYSVDENEIWGNLAVLSLPGHPILSTWMPSGEYALAVNLPRGYQYEILPSPIIFPNDLQAYGRLVGGPEKVRVIIEGRASYTLTVKVTPIAGYTPPWGIYREVR